MSSSPSVLLQHKFLHINGDIVALSRLLPLDFETLGDISIDQGLIQKLLMPIREALQRSILQAHIAILHQINAKPGDLNLLPACPDVVFCSMLQKSCT